MFFKKGGEWGSRMERSSWKLWDATRLCSLFWGMGSSLRMRIGRSENGGQNCLVITHTHVDTNTISFPECLTTAKGGSQVRGAPAAARSLPSRAPPRQPWSSGAGTWRGQRSLRVQARGPGESEARAGSVRTRGWGEGDPQSPQRLLPARGPLTPPVRRADTAGQPSSRFARSSERGTGDTASPWRWDRGPLEPGEQWRAEAEGTLGRGRGKLGERLRGGEGARRAQVALEGARRKRPGETSLPLACEASLGRRCKARTGLRGRGGASLGRGWGAGRGRDGGGASSGNHEGGGARNPGSGEPSCSAAPRFGCIKSRTHVRTCTRYFEKWRKEGNWNVVVHTWSFSWQGEGKGRGGLVPVLKLWSKRNLEFGREVYP